MEKLIKILSEIRPDVDFVNEKELIDEGILDSFDIISIISEINEIYNVEINVAEILPENFNSIESLKEMINRLKK